jgi:hypothetical protein
MKNSSSIKLSADNVVIVLCIHFHSTHTYTFGVMCHFNNWRRLFLLSPVAELTGRINAVLFYYLKERGK